MMLASGQMADALQKIGINLPFSHSVIFDTVARYGYFDTSNTQADFNWQPIPLEQTLKECLGWLKEQKLLK
jgi:nucleoside-diphosphate-sugar epimerase